jgi:heat shock protein HslJ
MRQTNLFRSLTFVSLLFMALLMSACIGPEPTPTPPPEVRVTQAVSNLSLIGTSWEAESFGEPEDNLGVIPGTRLTVNFGVDRYAGSGGCNWFLGVYETEGASLRFMTPAETAIMCDEPPGVMEQEGTFLSSLWNILEYRMDGEKLLGYTSGDQLMLTFVPAAPVPFEGTTWQLKFMLANEMMQQIIPGTEITAVFTADNMSGSSGCNTYEAGYTRDDESFAISDLTATTESCAEPAGVQEQELSYLAYLEIGRELVQAGGILILLDELGNPLMAFGAQQ